MCYEMLKFGTPSEFFFIANPFVNVLVDRVTNFVKKTRQFFPLLLDKLYEQ